MRSAILLGLAAMATAQLDFAHKVPRAYPIQIRQANSTSTSTSSTSTSTSSAVCTPLPTGSGPVPSPDTASAFLSSPTLSTIAAAAPIPTGYKNVFTNLQASSSTDRYMGFTTLTSYNTTACGAYCDSTNGCASFNVFFERDPSCVPTSQNPDPPSTNVIKCVLWGTPVSTSNTNNAGQYQGDFHVVIVGSNGYVANALVPVPGYTAAHSLGNAAINGVPDCNGQNTYVGSSIFNDGQPFDPARCAQACAATSAYNQGQGSSISCQFFNTYILYENGVSQGQFCAEYSQFLPDSYATNTGQVRGSDNYTIGSSYTFTNATDNGVPSNCKLAEQ